MSTDNAPHDRRFKMRTFDGIVHSTFLEQEQRGEKIYAIGGAYQTGAKYECPRCLFTTDFAEIGEGQCEYCDLHDLLESQSHPEDLEQELSKIRYQGKGKQFDCIIGISGGLDSSTLLYQAVRVWDLKPLVIHFDNGFNNEAAVSNMENLVRELNVNLIIYRLDHTEYMDLNYAFLCAGVPDADIPNDIAMTKLMYQTADQYGIKWILNGHDFRTEGSTPAKWTYMDAKYIQSVYASYTQKNLHSYPLFTFWDQIKYALKGIKQIRPFHYGFDRQIIEMQMKEEIGWQDYGAKHSENIYTEYVGSKLLPEKFGIDKRIVYLSAQVRSEVMDKREAKLIMKIKPHFDMSKLGYYRDTIERLSESPMGDRNDFDRYNFKRWKLIIWLLAAIKIVPYTFYAKYAK